MCLYERSTLCLSQLWPEQHNNAPTNFKNFFYYSHGMMMTNEFVVSAIKLHIFQLSKQGKAEKEDENVKHASVISWVEALIALKASLSSMSTCRYECDCGREGNKLDSANCLYLSNYCLCLYCIRLCARCDGRDQ